MYNCRVVRTFACRRSACIANYPRDFVPHADLGENYVAVGQYEKGIADTQEAVRLEPNDINTYANLAARGVSPDA